MSKTKIVFKKKYEGFESTYDIGRDVAEMWNEPTFHDVPNEFQGTLIVTVEYEEIPNEQD